MLVMWKINIFIYYIFFKIFCLEKEELIYQKLKIAAEQTNTFKVYKREDIPKKYHYGNNTRIGPIFIIAEVGYAFQNLYTAIDYYKKHFNITGIIFYSLYSCIYCVSLLTFTLLLPFS